MQDRFVGDVGDFGKYGLLRALTRGLAGCEQDKPTGYGDGGRALRLGVIWYYVATNGQLPPLGRAFQYLFNPSPGEQRLVECDLELLEIMRRLIGQGQRSVAAVEQSDALPADTVYFRDEVPANARVRFEWFALAANSVGECDLVFLDPDNGLNNAAGQQFATYEEAAQLWMQGKSLVIYQALKRNGNAEEQIQAHADQLRNALGIYGPAGKIIALRFHRTLARIFFVIPNPANPEIARLLRERIESFLECCWGTGRNPHFTRVDC